MTAPYAEMSIRDMIAEVDNRQRIKKAIGEIEEKFDGCGIELLDLDLHVGTNLTVADLKALVKS